MTTAPLPTATGQWEDEFNSRDPNAKGQPKSFEIPAEHFKELFPDGAEFPKSPSLSGGLRHADDLPGFGYGVTRPERPRIPAGSPRSAPGTPLIFCLNR